MSSLGYLHRILKKGRRYKRFDGLHLPPGTVWLHWSCELTAYKEKAGDRHQSLVFGVHVSLCYHCKQPWGLFIILVPSFLISRICLSWAYLKVYMRAILSGPLYSKSFPLRTCACYSHKQILNSYPDCYILKLIYYLGETKIVFFNSLIQ